MAPTPLFVDVARTPIAATPTTSLTTAPITAIPTTEPTFSPATSPTITEHLTPVSARASQRSSRDWNRILTRSSSIALLLLLVGTGIILFNNAQQRPSQLQTSNAINSTTIPLSEFEDSGSFNLLGGQSLIVNGQLRANESFVLAPQTAPTTGERGQIYYDNNSNQLAYYNGTQFINLPGAGFVQSFQGQSGDISLTAGNGITIAGTTVTNSGVTSFGGVTGDITLGPGLELDGTALQATGVQSLTSGSVALTVTDDGDGNLTITSTGGTGTVTSSGGTNGTIPLFTGTQNIEDSILTQAGGTTITVDGDLAVTGAITLSAPLAVAQGGTGAASFTTNSVIIGNGASAFGTVASGAPGLCLISTAGAPAFSACPGGVTSVNGLTGVLTIANATGVGSTITINDASTTQKGIAQFDATNFTHAGGLINTIQGINTAASPTFTGLTLSGDLAVNGGDLTSTGVFNLTPSGAMTLGAIGQDALLRGRVTTITSNGASNDIVLDSAGTIELQDATNITGNLTVTGSAIEALVVKASTNGSSALVLNVQQSDSDSILRLTDDGILAVGNATNIAGVLAIGNGAGADFVQIEVDNVTASQTLQLPNASGTICISSGNCGTTTGTLQAAYDFSAGGSTPEIKLSTGNVGIDIQDANSTIGSGQNFISFRGPNAGGLGNILFGVGTQGNLFMQPSTNRDDLIDINTNGGANLLTVNSNNSRVGIALGGSNLPAYTLDVGGTLNATGDTTIRGNSATAFQVLNGSTIPQFAVDTANSRVYVGNPSSDTTGALLVLDTKSDTGDPTGVNGGMYYNSAMGVMRCYADGRWANCNRNDSDSWGYNFEEDFWTQPTSDVYYGSTRFGKATNGTGSTAVFVHLDTGTRPGQVQLETGTTATGWANIYHTTPVGSGEWVVIGGGEEMEFAVNIPNLSNVPAGQEYDLRLGLCDTTNSDCDDGVYFEYDEDTSPNWRYATASDGAGAGGRNKQTSSKAVATGWTTFRAVANSAGTSITFYVKSEGDTAWTTLGTSSSNIPNTVANGTEPAFTIQKEAGLTNRTIKIDYFHLRANLTSQR